VNLKNTYLVLFNIIKIQMRHFVIVFTLKNLIRDIVNIQYLILLKNNQKFSFIINTPVDIYKILK